MFRLCKIGMIVCQYVAYLKLRTMSVKPFISFLSFEGQITHANQIPFLFDGIMDKILNRDSENQKLPQTPYDWA